MNKEPSNGAGQDEEALQQVESLDEAIIKLATQPKRQYTQQEIDEAREDLVLMNDRVFMATFMDNKNNHIVTGTANAVRKIHAVAPIPDIEQTRVQDLSLLDVLGRGMIGDLTGWGRLVSIAIEAQNEKQGGYAVRGILTTSNAMRINFNIGDDYTEAPDVITLHFLDFRLPELKNRKMFCSRIVSAEYESKETFLADKYSTYFIELPKMNDLTKADLPEEYHDLWDICCIFRARIKEQEEVIRMQAVVNPIALELSDEVRKAVTPNEFVNDTLNRKNELEQLREYMKRREQKLAQAEKQKGEAAGMEKMIITAIKVNAPAAVIEDMRKGAGITEARLAELRKQAQMA